MYFNELAGVTYVANMTLTRDTGSESMEGRWRVAQLKRQNIFPWVLRPPVSIPPIRTDMGAPGLWTNCSMVAEATVLTVDCTGGNVYLDEGAGIVREDEAADIRTVGAEDMNMQVDTIGRAVPGDTFRDRVVLPGWAEAEPELEVTAHDGSGRHAGLARADRAVPDVEIGLAATTDPPELAEQVTWTIPELPGSTLTVTSATRTGDAMTLRYEGMPRQNLNFGPRIVPATLASGGCPITVENYFSLYFPRDSTNHPEPNLDWPNWLYYWKKTPCGRPLSRDIGIDDLGGDGIPDSMDYALGFEPSKTLTYGPAQNVADLVEYNEHWMVLLRADQAFTAVQCNSEDWAAPGKQWHP